MQVYLDPGHSIRWGPSCLPSHKRGQSPHFSAHVCCGQIAGWIKMPLGVEVGLIPGDFMLDGDQAPLPKRGRSPLPNFRPMSIVAKRLDGSRFHFAYGGTLSMVVGLGPGHIVLDGDPCSSPPLQKRQSPPFWPIFIVRKRLDASRCHLVWRYASAKGTLC